MKMAKYINVLYDNGDEIPLSNETKEYLSKMLGFSWDRPVWDGTISVPDLPRDESLLRELRKYVSEERISVEPEQRVIHSLGKSSLEFINLMHGKIPDPVDAVIFPRESEIEELMRSCGKIDAVFTVTGGRTSVTGGVACKSGHKTVCIDTSNLKDLTFSESMITAGAGLTGKEIEDAIEKKGFTCGFFPESFRYSTVGGWISTKATGQESNTYGDIEDIVSGVKIARKGSIISEKALPRNSAGPSAVSIVLGAEGQNGVILSANMKIFRKPEKRHFSTVFFRSFHDAINAISEMNRYPTVLRVMDETETSVSLLEINRKTRDRLRRYLRLRGTVDGSLGIIVNNGEKFGRIRGSVSVGSSGAKSWYEGRYLRPRMANSLWKRGIVSDTMETSAFWDSVERIHSETISAFHKTVRENQGTGMIMAHLSHQYLEGSCIYFTFLINGEKPDMLLKHVREVMIQVILDNGGSITHHHGLGSSFHEYVDGGKRNLFSELRDEKMVWKWK